MASLCSTAVGNGTTTKSNYPPRPISGMTGLPHFLSFGRDRLGWTVFAEKNNQSVAVKVKKKKKIPRPWPDNPDPNVKGGVLFHLSHFKPFTEKPKPMALNFEIPLLALEKQIEDVKKAAIESKLDLADVITELEEKYQEALRQSYSSLTPIQKVHIARHPQRPTFLDHVFTITEKFIELHGDRAGYDDPAIVTGIGVIDGRRYMFIGHQKGRNTKENIMRNFAMPTPHGYRKALRMMKYADHHGFPILTFIDTPGAFADLKCEHLGQGEAIAYNLRTMFGLKVPIVCIVIGEGGSGGALAIGCGNKLLMLENSVFYVASPEACATILWKDAKCSPEAARKLRITSQELCELQIADGIIPEPLGGAHKDPEWTSLQIKSAINMSMEELLPMSTEELMEHRSMKFRKIGGYHEDIPIGLEKKFSMKRADIKVEKTPVVELKSLVKKLVEESGSSEEPCLDDMIERLKKEVNAELAEAFKTLRFGERVSGIEDDIVEAKVNSKAMPGTVMEKIEELKQKMKKEFKEMPHYETVNAKVEMLNELMRLKRKPEKERIAKVIMQSYGLEDAMYEMAMKAEAGSPLGALRGELKALMDETEREIYELMRSKEYADMQRQMHLELLAAGASSYDKVSHLQQTINNWFVDGLRPSKLTAKFDAIVAKISHFSRFIEYDHSFDSVP